MNTNLDTSTHNLWDFKPNWGWLFALGILLIVMGLIGLGMAVGLTIISMVFFGVMLIIAGVFHAIYVFRYRDWRKITWEALSAIFYILGGVIIITNPLLGSIVITAFLAAVFIIIGITRVITAFTLKNSTGWGWLFLAGLAAIFLGFIIYSQWPVSGLWFIGMFIAIELIMTGWSYIFMALSLRKLAP